MPYREDTQCVVHKLEYDFVTRKGKLVMDEHGCTDMLGCLKLFLKIDPAVQHIRTFQGERPDTEYKIIHGYWSSKVPWETHFCDGFKLDANGKVVERV
jgi:hypothetical protein